MPKKDVPAWPLPALIMLAALGCSRADQAPAEADVQTPPAVAAAGGCGDHGYLATTLVGAVEAEIDWESADLDCAGMPRPGGEGARLRFAGRADDRQLAIIIALPDLRRDRGAARELASNVTLIEEGAGRFFSTADTDICWTDVTILEPDPGAADRYRIGGNLYCVAPLVEVNGSSSVSLAELSFHGLLDWGAS
jgi:hypothetical protein